MWNEIDYISGADYVDAYVGNTPFLVNLKLELPTGGPIRPYIGAGAGGSAMFLDADYIELGGTGVWGTEGTVVFAYQFFAGVRFEFAERMSLGVEYRYGGTGDPEFESDWGYGDEGIRFGRIETHSVSATFTYRF